jgi:hypothetical protein
MNTWYLLATPDRRKKYKLRMLAHPIFSPSKIVPVANKLKQKYPAKKILVLKRTCQILKEIK